MLGQTCGNQNPSLSVANESTVFSHMILAYFWGYMCTQVLKHVHGDCTTCSMAETPHETEIFRLIDLYEQEECLWVTTHEHYHNKVKRRDALLRMMEKLESFKDGMYILRIIIDTLYHVHTPSATACCACIQSLAVLHTVQEYYSNVLLCAARQDLMLDSVM